MWITYLNSHFRYLKPQHKILRRKKAEPKTPHFLSLNQDIVAGSQETKWRLKYVMHSFRRPIHTLGFNAATELQANRLAAATVSRALPFEVLSLPHKCLMHVAYYDRSQSIGMSRMRHLTQYLER